MKTVFNLHLIKENGMEGYDKEEINKVLTPEQNTKFWNWFAGQTGGVTTDGCFIVFKYDWDRFVENELGILTA